MSAPAGDMLYIWNDPEQKCNVTQKSKEVKENFYFKKPKRYKWVPCVAKWVRSALSVSCLLKADPFAFFPKTLLYLREKINRTARKIECGMTVYAYSSLCIKQQPLELCHPVVYILILRLVFSKQWLFPAVVICSPGTSMFCRWPHECSQSWSVFFFPLTYL